MIRGVADVQLIGGAEREVHVELDRQRLAGRSLSSMHVVQAIQQAVRTIPSGRVRDRGTEYAVKFDADYDSVTALADLEIANDQGRRCHIRDIGQVRMATDELRQVATIDGQPCIAIKVVKKADANAVRVANAVREAMGKLNAELPGGMELIWVDDDGRFIEASNQSAWINVLQGILLTAGILFLFLYNLRSLFVVAVTMPLTIVIGLFFMQLVGYTLNTSTLIAIGMSVGILVTNSIVVLEAIVKRLDATGDPREASRLGAKEAFVAVLASAGTNVVVLFPLATMNSKVGMFIGPLAMTMFIMTVVSLFVSFTLTPLLCALILKPRDGESRFAAGSDGTWLELDVRRSGAPLSADVGVLRATSLGCRVGADRGDRDVRPVRREDGFAGKQCLCRNGHGTGLSATGVPHTLRSGRDGPPGPAGGSAPAGNA